jgi:molybdate transport system regulatory protein
VEPRAKVWLESGGKVVLGDFRARLLMLIDETGSLRAAAKELDIPYRRAWAKLREAEEHVGFQLVESTHGGAGGGGGSRLTPRAAKLVGRYQRLTRAIDRHLQAEFKLAFKT